MKNLAKPFWAIIGFLSLVSFAMGAVPGSAVVPYRQLDKAEFNTNAFPFVTIRLKSSQFSITDTGGIEITNISGVYGGSTNISTNSIWGIDGFGNITPIVTNNAVIATNIVRYGVGRMFGTESWLSKAITLTNGPNYLGAAENSQFFLIGPTTNPADCQIILSNAVATGQKLVLVNQTNAIPAEGAWTMTNNTPIPDGGGVVKLLGGYDLISTNGYISYFEFVSPDWQEVGRILSSGASGLPTNIFNSIVIYSNITLKGNSTLTINNLTITTNDLWHTNLVGGVATLQPVNLGLQPMIVKGLTVGTNTTSSALLPAALANNVLSSIGNTDAGDPVERYIYIAQATSNGNPRSWLKSVVLTNSNSFQLGGNDGTSQVTFDILELGGNDFQFLVQTNAATILNIHPTATDGNVAYTLDTDRPHTIGNVMEFRNHNSLTAQWEASGQWNFGLDTVNFTPTVFGLGKLTQFAYMSNSLPDNSLDTLGGIRLRTSFTATPSTPAWSSPMSWIGTGWSTNNAGAEEVRFSAYVAPVSGSTHPSGTFFIQGSSNELSPHTVFGLSLYSGYTGTGTNVFLDNGTFGAVPSGGVGGGGNMTNTGAAVVGMVPVATSTSGGSWTPTNVIQLTSLTVSNGIFGPKTLNRSTQITTNASYQNGLNVVAIGKNFSAVYNGTQYVAFIQNDLKVAIAARATNGGSFSITTLTNTVADNDEHRIAALAFDASGYGHLCYGMHVGPLLYIKTTAPGDVSTWTTNLPMTGVHETIVTYPMFVKNPTDGTLYFTYRYFQGNNGDQRLYIYNTNSLAWTNAPGTSTGDFIVSLPSSLHSAYVDGLPKWDSHGSLWFSWSWDTFGWYKNLVQWNGANPATNWNGTVQTVPINFTNVTPIITTTNIIVQSDFCIDPNDKIYIPYCVTNSSGAGNVHVLENTTGTFVDHSITQNVNTNNIVTALANLKSSGTNTVPLPSPTAFYLNGAVYVVWPDGFSDERGLVYYRSTNAFSTTSKAYVLQDFNPNWGLNYCPDLIKNGIISFMFEVTDDILYGQSYIFDSSENATRGHLRIVDWVPGVDNGFSHGIPADLVDLNGVYANVVQGNAINANNLYSKGVMTAGGNVSGNAFTANGSSGFQVVNNGYIGTKTSSGWFFPSDGVIRMINAAANDFNRLQWGGISNTYPALARQNAGLAAVTATNDAPSFLLSTRAILAKTTNYTLVASNGTTTGANTDISKVISNFGASILVTNTLPSAVAGYTYTFMVEATNGMQILAAANNTIQIAGTQSAAAGFIWSTNIGNTVTLVVGSSGTNWMALSHEGTWTFGP